MQRDAPGPWPAPPALPGASRGPRRQEGEAPDAHVAEEGKRVIRELVARQTDVTLSLEQQQSRERQFSRASAVLPLGCVSSGAASLQEFRLRAAVATRREELVGLGLSKQDVELLLARDGESPRLSEPERLARAERLQSLQDTVTRAAQPAQQVPQESSRVSRHVAELGASLREDGAHSQFVRLALLGAEGEASGRAEPLEHPLHQLPALERRLFGHLEQATPPPAATSRKRRRLRKAIEAIKARVHQVSRDPSADSGASGRARAGSSLWDSREPVPARPSVAVPPAAPKPHGPHRLKQYTIRDGHIVELGARALLVPDKGRAETGVGHLSVEDLRKDRLSIEEIRELPKFTNYEAGTPSPVLYVKNLSRDVTEEDLASVFGAFSKQSNSSILDFRLCSGRMRGQAFVTFPNNEDASQALSEVNGYRLKGRPMIVHFARGQP